MGLKSLILSAGLKSALSGGAIPLILIAGGISFTAGAVSAWKITDIRAKADRVKAVEARENQLKLDHAQAVVDINGELTAKAAKIEALEKQVADDAAERKEQNKAYAKGNANLKADFNSLKAKIENAKGDFYEMPIPDDTVDILNCAFDFIVCDKFGNPVTTGASPAENFQGYDKGQVDYRRNSSNPPAKD